MSKGRTRVDFNAPEHLVEQADAVAELLDVSRTDLLIDALRDEIDELAAADDFRRLVSDAYYAEEIEFEAVESILGTEAAMRMQLLRSSLDRDPPGPRVSEEAVPAAEFYDGDVPEWTPDDAEPR